VVTAQRRHGKWRGRASGCQEGDIRGDLKLVRELGSYQRYRIGNGGIGEDKGVRSKITLFLFTSNQEELRPLDPDNPEAKWIPKEKVPDFLTHPKDKEFYLNFLKNNVI
jgi:hypothetical protein